MPSELVGFEVSEGIATVTVNRPEKLNALNRAVIGELEQAFARAESTPEVRGIIVTGAGEKAFVAGADVREIAGQAPLESREMAVRGQRIFRSLETMGKPSIAAINGYALGGGLELALCCTLRVASENAKLGLPEIKLGLLPGYGGTQRLPRLVGAGRALELMLTGEPVDARRAEAIGLVNHVVPQADLMPFCRALMGRIVGNAPVAAAMIMQAVEVAGSASLEDGLRFEAAAFAAVAATEDMREGTAAFVEKRKPSFKGR